MATFLHFSVSEVDDGLSYAKEHHGVYLNRDTLRNLANQVGTKWTAAGKKPHELLRIKRLVLLDVWERHGIDSARRDTYSAAIGHMFGVRSREARKARAAKRCGTPAAAPACVPPPPPTYGFGESGQGEFLFGNRN